MKVVVIGATSAIAEQCCRLWAGEGAEFVLMARDAAKAEQIADDLKVRGARSVVVTTGEFFDPAAIMAFADATVAKSPEGVTMVGSPPSSSMAPRSTKKCDTSSSCKRASCSRLGPPSQPPQASYFMSSASKRWLDVRSKAKRSPKRSSRSATRVLVATSSVVRGFVAGKRSAGIGASP